MATIDEQVKARYPELLEKAPHVPRVSGETLEDIEMALMLALTMHFSIPDMTRIKTQGWSHQDENDLTDQGWVNDDGNMAPVWTSPFGDSSCYERQSYYTRRGWDQTLKLKGFHRAPVQSDSQDGSAKTEWHGEDFRITALEVSVYETTRTPSYIYIEKFEKSGAAVRRTICRWVGEDGKEYRLPNEFYDLLKPHLSSQAQEAL